MFQENWRIQLHIPLILKEIILNIWLVFLAGIIGGICVFSYGSLIHKPLYTSEVTFSVSPKSSGSYVGFYSSLNAANEMAEVFGEVFSSDVLKRLIEDDLNGSSIDFTVSAAIVEDTNILRVTSTSNTPANAHEVMQAVLRNYGKVSDYLFGGVVLDPIRSPHVPLAPSNPYAMTKQICIWSFLSMFLMVAFIVFLSLIRKTVKTEDGARYYLQESPIGIMLREKQHVFGGKKRNGLLITKTSVSFRYVESMLHVAQKVRQKMREGSHKVLMVTAVAENEGKTTVAANIALSLSKHGNKVALVDMDMRRPALHKLFSETIKGDDLAASIKNGISDKMDGNFYLFTVNTPVKNIGKLLHDSSLERFFRDLREKVDYIIIDTPPYMAVADTGMILKYVDCSLMVVRQDWVPGKVLKDVASELDESRPEYLGYVINHYIDDGSKSRNLGYYGRYGKYGYYSRETDE